MCISYLLIFVSYYHHKYVREQPYSISTEMMILRAAPLYITTTHKDFLLHLEKLKDLFPSSTLKIVVFGIKFNQEYLFFGNVSDKVYMYLCFVLLSLTLKVGSPGQVTGLFEFMISK